MIMIFSGIARNFVWEGGGRGESKSHKKIQKIQIQYVFYLHFFFLDKILRSTQSTPGLDSPMGTRPLPPEPLYYFLSTVNTCF